MDKDLYWAKVLFREFSSHFIRLTDEEIVRDIRESIVALTCLDQSGSSFGSKMVSWANERKTTRAAQASAKNGESGGRPPSAPIPPPADKSEFAEFVAQKNLPENIAQDWYALNSERGWNDHVGNRIKNWKGALINYCKKELKKLKGEQQ